MNNFTQHYEFSAPQVPVASPADGLMPVDSLDQPVMVEIVLWSAMRPDSSVQLKLDGILVGGRKTLTSNDKPGDVIIMELDKEYLTDEGSYTLCYLTINNANQVSENSPSIPLLIDRTALGAALLAPAIFHQINLGNTLTGIVPGYAGMQPGDRIQTFCNDRQGPAYEVTSDNLTDRPVPIIFDKEFLLNLHSDSVTISYRVIDRAGNISLPARSVTLSMQV
ncbi:hypothetical protein PSTH1771_04380 [Pseudomonas syringae pv. theae]|uniref:hypothetical protein n=1 Tax=Pseudomonas syringae TaxID=317 RepID=UPI0023C99CA6|nr:hypothetical protein [Pseudomonas syringae]GKS04214.1 hypothetical protein PSTH1771_04380 [Pseudomonas syringae pv. theae]